MRLARTILLLSLLSTTSLSGLAAQQTNSVSATMLRVLAEAADVHRTGRPVFLVADYRFPHYVIGHFPTRAKAERVKADSGTTFGVFGPYVTQPDRMRDKTSRIVSVTIETGGRRVTRPLDPNIDALFLSMSAVDKFMVPYYQRIYGPTFAQRLRNSIDTIDIKGRPICHKFSFPCEELHGQIIRVWDPTEPYRQ